MKELIINDDGYSVKGCKYIYASAGQAGEYAPLTVNPYRGCGTACRYCYVPIVLKMKREEFDAGATPRPNFIQNLRADAEKYRRLGLNDQQVFTTFTSDVFNPFDTSITRAVLELLIEYGFGFCTLTKGGPRALPFMDLFRADRDAFAATLTSLDDKFSKLWEPKAALPSERIDVLKKFHKAGIFTWVSLEPTLNVEASLQIVQATHEFVDLYKVGRANYLPMTKNTNWQDYTHRMIELLQKLGARHYIKNDLQKYLPPGYYNPMRIVQHN
jgi:DNA repair photolyase